MVDAAGEGTNGGRDQHRDTARRDLAGADAAPVERSTPRQRDWVEIATLLVLVLTLFAAGFAAYEGSVLSRATNDLVKTQATNAHREVRAYVGVVPGGVENFGEGEAQRFTLFRKNYGTSPAYNVVVQPTLAAVIRSGDQFNEAENAPPGGTGLLTLFPGMSLPFAVAGAGSATKEQIEQVREGKDVVFVYAGIVTYYDSYGEEHYTRYCWMFRGPVMTDRDAEWCPHHNDAN